MYATGTLLAASEVLLAGHGYDVFPAGEGLGEASSIVELVVMGGHFTSNGPEPPGRPVPTGTVLSVTIDAHTGYRQLLTLGDKLPALSKLGPITRLK